MQRQRNSLLIPAGTDVQAVGVDVAIQMVDAKMAVAADVADNSQSEITISADFINSRIRPVLFRIDSSSIGIQ
jgi:hypothetical protein